KTAALSFCHDRLRGVAAFVIPSMLDLIEACRARLHALIISNLAFDHFLVQIRSMPSSERDTMIARLEDFRKVIATQAWDPNFYLHDGHVGFDIGDTINE